MMADLTSNFIGIKSPNPFWLASAPPTDKEYNVRRAFQAGWGGVVWKTLGSEGPPVVNVSGPRYGAVWGADRRLLGLNNRELITGCPHGMAERGMGSAVGQVPEYIEMVTRWVKKHSRMPCIVKLTPNISDVRKPAEAAKRGGADAVSLINTI